MQVSRIKVFSKGDINGFFGLFTNNLTNVMVMAGLLSFSVGLPDEIVYGRILPAVGISILCSSVYYSFMAYRLAKKDGRNDVTALPSGTSVPHMFLIVFMIIGPVYWTTGDPYLAWYAGIAWCFIEGIVELSGAIIGNTIRRLIPRAAMLGTLAGVSITYIAMNPALKVWQVPYIGFASLSVIIIGWLARDRMPFNLPTGLVAIILGTILGWAGGHMNSEAFVSAVSSVKPSLPQFSIGSIINGFSAAAPFLAAAVPFGIYNFIETMDNVESAAVAGDEYNTSETMLADGATSILGSLLGSPFPTAVFIGHPGWKETGAGIGYTLLTGIGAAVITCFGLVSLLLTIIPIEAIIPILLYIGIIIGTQAFTSIDSKHIPAVVLAFIPWIADWSQGNIDTSLGLVNTSAKEIGMKAFADAGLDYSGMISLGSGTIIISMIWASIVKFAIDKDYKKAVIAALAGAVLSFFGIIHVETIGLGTGSSSAAGYLFVILVFSYYLFKKERSVENEKIDCEG